jgi:Na+/H+-dicarboxylate symporter
MRLTTQIFTAMIAGAGAGILINLYGGWVPEGGTAAAFLDDHVVHGLLAVVGQGFMRLLTVLVVPLVFVSLVCGTAALEDIRRLGRIGAKALGLYLLTTSMAIALAMGLALAAGPGRGFGLGTGAAFEAPAPPPLTEVLVGLFPRNLIAAMAEGHMLQVIVFAVLFGLAISLSGDPGRRVLAVFTDFNAVILRLVGIVMVLAPYGVFALIARTFAGEGLDAFRPLLGYFVVVLGALLVQGLVVYPLLLRVFSGLRPLVFLKKLREVHLFAFSTASSNATIPVTLRAVETRLGVPNSIASFTVPLGATINMDGTAIMQGAATVFIAQAYGISLGAGDILTVILTATLASIGTAGVPGVGLVMLGMVLTQVGLPVEGIALIIGIDRLLDMVRTAVNVTGDAMVSCIVARSENCLDGEVYES